MALKKVTTYVDEDLLRSVKVLAASTDSKVYEVLDEALRRHLGEQGKETQGSGVLAGDRGESLSDAISRFGGSVKSPGMSRNAGEESISLNKGEMLSEAVVSERESSRY